MESNSKGNITVGMLVENAFFSAGLEAIINNLEHCEVLFTTMSESALLTNLTELNAPAICIMDINVHTPGSKEIIQQLKVQCPAMKILVLSKADHPYNILRSLNVGADGHISKAADPKTIHRALISIHFTGCFFAGNPAFENGYANTDVLMITESELRMLHLFCTELSAKEIAAQTGLTLAIVDGYRQILFEKLKVHTRESMVVTAYKIGLISKLELNTRLPESNSYLPNLG